MRQVIENRLNKYNVLDVDNDVTVLEFLKQRNLKSSFHLQHISKDCFDIMSKCDRMVYIPEHKYVAGYSYQFSNSFNPSGGLKLADENSRIFGSFTVDDEKIVYSPIMHFYEEKDASIYLNGNVYYTTMTMNDLLVEELKKDRKFLIDLGKRLRDFKIIQEYEEISCEEMLEFATYVDKGRDSFKKLKKKFY